MDQVRVGLIGSAFSSNIHAEAFEEVPEAVIVAVCSPNRVHVAEFAQKWKVPVAVTDYRKLLDRKDIDVVVVGIPNDLHREVVVAAAKGGKHSGPHSDWFYDVKRSGGGSLMDMGCHGIEWARWMYGKPKPKSVVAHSQRVLHTERTKGEDNSVVIVEFEGGGIAVIENSWAKHGGMDDRVELYGTEGVIYCDLLHGSSMENYSKKGYGYAVEKAGETRGWTFTVFEEAHIYGFPHEMRHFIRCVLNDETPHETGEDGRATLEIIYAAYESAGAGKRITWPYKPKKPGDVPVNLWLKA